jgi:hypothetical protein
MVVQYKLQGYGAQLLQLLPSQYFAQQAAI